MKRLIDHPHLGPAATGLALATAGLSLWSPWWAIPTVLLAFAAGRLPGRTRTTVLITVGVLAAGLVALMLAPAWIPLGYRFLALLLAETMLPWFAGRFWRQYRDLAEAGREGARLRERARIAGDMHDVLGHELSLIALSAGALKLAPDLPAGHRTAVADIRARAESAVDRLGEVVGLLREAGVGQGPEQVAELVAGARAAGMTVELNTTDGHAVPLGVSVAARHVVQEALTNAARHAAGAHVTVDVRHEPKVTTVTVTNAPGGAGGRTRGGNGLTGLADRVHALGGGFEAAPDESGGFTVSARLPHTPGSEPPPPPRQRSARRRIRVTIAAAVLVPMVSFALIGAGLRGWEMMSARGSVLDAEVFASLRPGQDRAEFAHLLPGEQTPAHPEVAEPEGVACEYYEITVDPFDDRSGDAYRLCFEGPALVSAEIVGERPAA
ncbi:histidine kinase [Phytomonospora sp. NPDC050363]|uniref:sensor histidine kinase n=1 Tax=Phytomonospora sp. NPDC050363 TaxID=3155642 RepID=UPI0033D28EFD